MKMLIYVTGNDKWLFLHADINKSKWPEDTVSIDKWVLHKLRECVCKEDINSHWKYKW